MTSLPPSDPAANAADSPPVRLPGADVITIPIIEETATIAVHTAETGRVRVVKEGERGRKRKKSWLSDPE